VDTVIERACVAPYGEAMGHTNGGESFGSFCQLHIIPLPFHIFIVPLSSLNFVLFPEQWAHPLLPVRNSKMTELFLNPVTNGPTSSDLMPDTEATLGSM
jgi:hypothetical protein